MTGQADTAVIQSGLGDPGTMLAHPDTHRLVDLTQPPAILSVAELCGVGRKQAPR